jgi:hypothetical protein
MKSLERYNDFISNLQKTKGELLTEKDKHERQLSIFQNELEAATLMSDSNRIKKAQQGIEILTEKLNLVNSKIGDLDETPYLLDILFEAEDLLGQYQEQATTQWQKVVEARINLLKELEFLGKIKRESEVVSWSTKDIMQKLRRNPLEVVKFGYNKNLFCIDLPIITKYLG